MRTGLCLGMMGFILAMPSAFAGESVSELTARNIKSFIQETTELTHQGNGLDEEGVRDYLDTHLYDRGSFRSLITYEVPGHQAQQQQMGLNKKKFIKNVIQGREALENYTSSVELMDHEIADDGQTAKIQTVGEESGLMPMQEGQMAAFEGRSECTQHLKIEENTIILISANCETVFTFLEN